MEQEAIQEEEVAKARSAFRVEIARVKKLSESMNDPAKLAALSDLPPHLQGRG